MERSRNWLRLVEVELTGGWFVGFGNGTIVGFSVGFNVGFSVGFGSTIGLDVGFGLGSFGIDISGNGSLIGFNIVQLHVIGLLV